LSDRVPVRVAVLPADPSVQGPAADAVDALQTAGGRLATVVDARSGVLTEPEHIGNGAGPDRATGVVLVRARPPGGRDAGEAVALACDLTVVVVPAGARAADLRQLGDELANFGIVPVWALLTARGRRAVRRQQRQLADAVAL
jgi:hypothetical protein